MGKRSRRRDATADQPESPPGATNGSHDEPAVAPPVGSDKAADSRPASDGVPDPRDRALGDLQGSAAAIEVLYQLYRFTALTGAPPEPSDWPEQGEWPPPWLVEEVFGSWEELIAESGLDAAAPARAAAAHEARRQELDAEAARLDARTRTVERNERKLPELQRRFELAHDRRREAEDAAGAAERALERARDDAAAARRDADAARAQAEALEADIEAGDAGSTAARERHADEWAAQLAAEQAAHADTRERLARSHEESARLADELQIARERLEGVGRRLADAHAPDTEAEPGGEEDDAGWDLDDVEPRDVKEAVLIARHHARHLRFASRALQTADESPFTRPRLVLEQLAKLDRLAGLYLRPEGIGRPLTQAAQEVGITQWASDVSETTRSMYAEHYRFRYDGHQLPLDAHVRIGSGAGANFVARIYLHVADGKGEVPRGFYVGVVGKHLPDTTT